MPDTCRLSDILASWHDWPLPLSAPPKVLGAIEGGRTNRNIKLQVKHQDPPIILRLHNLHSQQLGIDRQQEADIIQTVSRAGITPEPLYRDPLQRFVLLPYIEGRTWSQTDFQQQHQRLRLLELLAQVRRLTPAIPRRSYRQYLNNYWQQLIAAQAIDDDLSRRWQKFYPPLEHFDRQPWSASLTHHDVIPENIIDTGDRLYLIDWEYAALGHSDIDLWCIDPQLAQTPFIAELMHWTNDLWQRVAALYSPITTSA